MRRAGLKVTIAFACVSRTNSIGVELHPLTVHRSVVERSPGTATFPSMKPRLARPLQILLLAAAYFGAAKLGFTWASAHPNVSPVWPPSGIAIAALLLLGLRAWPGILIGAFLANFFTPIHPVAAAGIAAGNTLEAVAAAWLLDRVDFHKSL